MRFKSKHSVLLRDIVVSGLLFFGLIALFLIFVTTAANSYNRPDIIDPRFSTNFNKLNQLTSGPNGIDVTRGSVSSSSGLQLLGNFDIAFSSMWTVFNLVWATIDMYASMPINYISELFGLDAVVVSIVAIVLIGILVTLTVFGIISSVLRGRV